MASSLASDRPNDSAPKRRWSTRNPALLTVGLIACIVLFAGVREWRLYVPQVSFDSEAWKFDDLSSNSRTSTIRQQMLTDVITQVLPGKSRSEIESLLGESPSHTEMRRYSHADLAQPTRRLANGEYEPYPRTGDGWYSDQYDWDLIYPIGKERVFIFNHRGVAQYGEYDDEYLILRLNVEGRFDSWCVDGSSRWPSIVGALGRHNYSTTR